MRRSVEERLALVDDWRGSGETIRAFCERNEGSIDSFKRWKRKAGQPSEESASFLPVVINTRKTPPYRDAPCQIMVGNVMTIECTQQTSQKALETALRAAVRVCGPTSAA